MRVSSQPPPDHEGHRRGTTGGLLDYAQYFMRTRDAEGAAAAIKEARAIAGRLCCQPLLDRAADIAPAKSAVQDQVAAVPDLEEPTDPAGVTPAAAP